MPAALSKPIKPQTPHQPLPCRGTCKATRSLVTGLPVSTWRAAGGNSLPPLHPLLQAAQPWACLQQQVQLHARVTTPKTWSKRWTRLSAQHRGVHSPNCQLYAWAPASALVLYSVEGAALASCPLLTAEAEALCSRMDSGTGLQKHLHWAPDGSRLALPLAARQPPQNVALQVLEVRRPAWSMTRLPLVELPGTSQYAPIWHIAAWAPCSERFALCQSGSDSHPINYNPAQDFEIWVYDKQGAVICHHPVAALDDGIGCSWVHRMLWAPDSSAVALLTPGHVLYILRLGCAAVAFALPCNPQD